MRPIRIFISSVQQEFAQERKALAEYIRTDALLGRFFEVFIFEEMPAKSQSTVQVYLGEVEQADIYLALMGANYGYEDAEGVSPTEREFDLATKLHKDRLILLNGWIRSNATPKKPTLSGKLSNVLFVNRLEITKSCVRPSMLHWCAIWKRMNICVFYPLMRLFIQRLHWLI